MLRHRRILTLHCRKQLTVRGVLVTVLWSIKRCYVNKMLSTPELGAVWHLISFTLPTPNGSTEIDHHKFRIHSQIIHSIHNKAKSEFSNNVHSFIRTPWIILYLWNVCDRNAFDESFFLQFLRMPSMALCNLFTRTYKTASEFGEDFVAARLWQFDFYSKFCGREE